MTTKVLPLFGDYFGIKFNLSKIDMVAVPDFGFSAMENWGLITFRFVEYTLNIDYDIENEPTVYGLLFVLIMKFDKECGFNLS